MPLGQLRRWTEWAEVIFAADSGADRLAELGIEPDAVLGDLDSISRRSEGDDNWLDSDTETTDCDKLLLFAIAQGHREITLASIEGDQLDHMIATLHSAAKHPIDVQIALRTGVGQVLVGSTDVVLAIAPNRRVSLLPLTECKGVSIEGVEWPLLGVDLHPLGQTSIGNRSSSSEIHVHIESGVAFLYAEISVDEFLNRSAVEPGA